jgi:hypothetical protein
VSAIRPDELEALALAEAKHAPEDWQRGYMRGWHDAKRETLEALGLDLRGMESDVEPNLRPW